MPKFIDLAGARFGSWDVLAPATRPSWWLCRCKCGAERPIRGDTLRGGHSTKCQPCRKNVPLPEVASGMDISSGAAAMERARGFEQREHFQATWMDAYQSNGGIIQDSGAFLRVIPLTQGFFTVVDEEDFAAISRHKWRLHTPKGAQNHYAVTHVGRGVSASMHRIILSNPEYKVDHKDLYGLNNRRSNLRQASTTMNNANSYLRNHNSTGFKGVVIQKGRFSAQICVNRVNKRLGVFYSAEAAAKAYDAEARRHFGEFARTNFPEYTNG